MLLTHAAHDALKEPLQFQVLVAPNMYIILRLPSCLCRTFRICSLYSSRPEVFSCSLQHHCVQESSILVPMPDGRADWHLAIRAGNEGAV